MADEVTVFRARTSIGLPYLDMLITPKLTHNPLAVMKMTQPFGTFDPTLKLPLGNGRYGTYRDLGLKGHNGWDLSLHPGGSGTIAYAVADGVVEARGNVNDSGYGLEARLRIPFQGNPTIFLEVIYAHLQKVLKTGPVKAGDPIVECDNSGISTGPHLHLGTKIIVTDGDGSRTLYNDNGFAGWLDPAQFFAEDPFYLFVDKAYGMTERSQGVPSRLAFAPAFLYFMRTQRRLPSPREYNALRYGFWDLRAVLDPAMFTVWSAMTKPEAQERGIVR